MMLLFITFRWLDLIDILLVAVLLYQLFYLIRGTTAVNIFFGLLFVYLFWLVVKALKMQLLSTLLGQFVSVGVIALIIIFQQELRRFLLMLGSKNIFSREQIRGFITLQSVEKKRNDKQLVRACMRMSELKTGALIVLTQRTNLRYIAATGVRLDSEISENLIESIFFKNNPLHDGAILIDGNRIVAAKCVLPLTERTDFPFALGLRHRAAVGMTEQSDAVVICISEQTGDISLARDGQITTNVSREQLQEVLSNTEF